MTKQPHRKPPSTLQTSPPGKAPAKPRRLSSERTLRALEGVLHVPLPGRVRALRESCGYPEHAVARGIGISQPTYHLVESGVTRLSLERLWLLAEFYRIPLTQLAKGYELTPEEARTVHAAPLLRAASAEPAVA